MDAKQQFKAEIFANWWEGKCHTIEEIFQPCIRLGIKEKNRNGNVRRNALAILTPIGEYQKSSKNPEAILGLVYQKAYL